MQSKMKMYFVLKLKDYNFTEKMRGKTFQVYS